MSGNGGGGYGSCSYACKDNQWKAFDRLPRSVRNALNEAVCDWAPYPIWRWWNAGKFKSANELVMLIKKWDRDEIKRSEARLKKAFSQKRRAYTQAGQDGQVQSA
jgi:hypothetical protein